MGQQIIKQPNRLLAVFSSVTETFIIMDATPDEIIEWRAKAAAEAARENARREVDRILAGETLVNPYFQFAYTWEEASQMDREHAV